VAAITYNITKPYKAGRKQDEQKDKIKNSSKEADFVKTQKDWLLCRTETGESHTWGSSFARDSWLQKEASFPSFLLFSIGSNKKIITYNLQCKDSL